MRSSIRSSLPSTRTTTSLATAAIEVDQCLEDLLAVGVIDCSLQLVEEEDDGSAQLFGERARQRQDLSRRRRGWLGAEFVEVQWDPGRRERRLDRRACRAQELPPRRGVRDRIAAVDDELQEDAGVGIAALGDFDPHRFEFRLEACAGGVADRRLPDPSLA